MRPSKDLVIETVAAFDPFRWQSNDNELPSRPVRGTAKLRRRLAKLRSGAAAMNTRGIAAVADAFASADLTRPFGVVRTLPPLAGRHPLVLAHGPSLNALIPAIRANRDRLYIVAPFRTALRLAESDVVSDVVVLADAHLYVSGISVRAWQSAHEDVRRALSVRSALVIDACAPHQIVRDFYRVHLFDDGLGWLSRDAMLPFWGSSTLPAVCLPLALGADTIAVGGIDLSAESGKAMRSWSGKPMRLDSAMATTQGLLEAVAEALLGQFVDVSHASSMKCGFAYEPIDRLIQRQAIEDHARPSRDTATLRDLAESMLERAWDIAGAVEEMSAAAERLCALAASPVISRELDELVTTIEHEWRVTPAYRAATSFIQPPYLQSLWQLAEAGVTPRNPALAVQMKARLVGPEVADLDRAFRHSVDACRRALERPAA